MHVSLSLYLFHVLFQGFFFCLCFPILLCLYLFYLINYIIFYFPIKNYKHDVGFLMRDRKGIYLDGMGCRDAGSSSERGKSNQDIKIYFSIKEKTHNSCGDSNM